VDFHHDGRARRWVTALPAQVEDGRAAFAAKLADLYGRHAHLVDARPATAEEEAQYVAGTLPRNVYCPVLRGASARSDRRS
jgi:hypothetical protein